nr:aminotransferase class IV [Bacteroidales bacterium]
GIKNNTYITPDSRSILPSITNKSLKELATHLGLKVECRPVPLEELPTFEEAGECGTAAVITPIDKIFDPKTGTIYSFCKNGQPGPVSTMLYRKLTGIQFGEEPDPFGWMEIID